MSEDVRFIEKAIGKVSYDITNSALPSLKNRSSLYVSEKIKKGDFFTSKNISAVRPGLGLHPKHFNDIVGNVASKDLNPGQNLAR